MLYKPNTLLYLHYRQQITSEVKEHLTSMQQVDRRHYQQHPELPLENLWGEASEVQKKHSRKGKLNEKKFIHAN